MNSNSNSPPSPFTEDDIVRFLSANPEFFSRHAELLADLRIFSPHGKRVVSLQERQAEMLRDKIRGLEGRIMALIRNGAEFNALNEHILNWAASLLQTTDPAHLPGVLVEQLQTRFQVPQVAIRLWQVVAPYSGQNYAEKPSPELIAWVDQLAVPYCGPPVQQEIIQCMAQPSSVRSMAVLALRQPQGKPLGLLAFGSPDPDHYRADMATDILVRIGQLASAALERLSDNT